MTGHGVILSLFLCCLCLSLADARWTIKPRRTTTPRTRRTTTTEKPDSDLHQHVHHWPPAEAAAPPIAGAPVTTESSRLIEGYDQRSADGHYEFRYQLSNGDTRYERAYWLPVGKNLILARKGFYSIPLPNAQYSTVFYTADHLGYHVDMHTLSGKQPLLPRSLEVPVDGAQTKRNSMGTEPEAEQKPEPDVEASQVGDELYNKVETETPIPSTEDTDNNADDDDDEQQ